MKNLKNEQGRSMVEMLGVLAIIGVLTVAGVAGFRYAMNKHYANQTVNRLMKRAVVVAAQANFGQNLSLHEFDENDGEYKITLLDPTNNESFTMQVEDIPQEVCQQILGMDWKLAKMNPDNCSEETINFMFLNELTDCTHCQPDSIDCPPESEMQCGKCSVVKGFMDNNNDCEGKEGTPYCVRGKCTTCDDGYFGSQCVACSDTNTIQNNSESTQHNCLGTMIYNFVNKYMYGCEVNIEKITSAEEYSCKQCPNRCFVANSSNSACRIYGGTTGFNKNADGTCSDCLKDYYGFPGQCTACSDTANQKTADVTKHNCLSSMIYNFGNGYMYGCKMNITNITSAEEYSCIKCPNRCFVKNSSNSSCQVYGEGYTYTGKDDDGYCTN